ncbi:unnamed protein product, partial [Heterosigma akashiwo]
LSRRKFIEGSVSAATAAGFLLSGSPDAVSASSSSAASIAPIQFPKMGIGCWAWGDALFWEYRPKEDEELRKVFDYAVSKGVNFFDTAELYGLGRSEELIRDFRKGKEVVVASKFAALPWRTSRQDVVKACKKSVERLGGQPIDLYQVHFPNAWANEAYWEGMADCVDLGLVKNVGVSNYGSEALRAAASALEKRGVTLASNQIQMSLVYRCPLDNGLVKTCQDLGVHVLSYSPLGLGLVTGKYSLDKLPSGPRAKLRQTCRPAAWPAALAAAQEVAAARGGAPLTQVCLNWAIAKGTTPIPGARNLGQIAQNLAALEWSLSGEEVAKLDEAFGRLQPLLPPEKAPFPKKSTDTNLVMFDS